MFRGEYHHSLDAKWRFIVPARLRDELGDKFIITKGFEGCLFIYGMKEWEALEEKFNDLRVTDEGARHFGRFFIGSAFEAESDGQGRTILPLSLREYAGITKEIVSTGVGKRIEIWSKERWIDYTGKINVNLNRDANLVNEELSKKMFELGI